MHGLTGGDWKRTGDHRHRASPRPSEIVLPAGVSAGDSTSDFGRGQTVEAARLWSAESGSRVGAWPPKLIPDSSTELYR